HDRPASTFLPHNHERHAAPHFLFLHSPIPPPPKPTLFPYTTLFRSQDCVGNVMIWLGSGPFPEPLPARAGCFTLLTGAEGLQYWNDAVARWKAEHPAMSADLGPPIVSLYSPADSTTLTGVVTLTATAVDDQAVAGVQFALDGQNIGAEVTTESAATKFTLPWDSHAVANGTYALTARVRDGVGQATTSAGVTVTISN